MNGDNREFSAEYFEVTNGGDGEVKIEKKGGKLTATLSGQQLRKLDAKVFKDKENFTTKEIISYVTKGRENICLKVIIT